MKKPILTLSFFLFLALSIFPGCTSPSDKDKTIGDTVVNGKPVMDESKCAAKSELRTNMRKLWEEHVTWTRNVILNIMDDLPGTDQAVKRLLKNQDDIGNAIKPYYGDDAGNKLTELLHTHITQAADLLKAAKKNDKAEFERIDKEWHDNAGQIAQFLSSANPNWKQEDMKKMMDDHLKLTTDEAVARQKKDYDGDVEAYDKVHDEILKMSDMLYMGIAEQFPDKIK